MIEYLDHPVGVPCLEAERPDPCGVVQPGHPDRMVLVLMVHRRKIRVARGSTPGRPMRARTSVPSRRDGRNKGILENAMCVRNRLEKDLVFGP